MKIFVGDEKPTIFVPVLVEAVCSWYGWLTLKLGSSSLDINTDFISIVYSLSEEDLETEIIIVRSDTCIPGRDFDTAHYQYI